MFFAVGDMAEKFTDDACRGNGGDVAGVVLRSYYS